MLPGKRRLIAGLAGVVAAVLFVDVDPMKWYHEQSAVYSVDKNDLFNYITSPGDVKDVSQDADKLVQIRLIGHRIVVQFGYWFRFWPPIL